MKIDADKMSREIKFVKISSLRPYEKNARTHSDSQVKKIAASITEFGFTNPILIDGNKGIIAGHGRLAAAKLLGLDAVPVIELTHMTEAQKRAYVISDNSIALQSGWDMDILAEELKAIENDGMNLELTGFSDDELKTIMMPGFLEEKNMHERLEHENNSSGETGVYSDPNPYVDDEEKEESAPDLEEKHEFAVKNGDIWILGNHRLMCGDSTSSTNASILTNGEKVEMVVTDPPYGVSYVGKTKDALTIQNDGLDDESFYSFLILAFKNIFDFVLDGGAVYIWHADTKGHIFRKAMVDSGLKLAQCCIWVKNSLVLGRQDYHWKHEPCLYGWKPGEAHRWRADRSQTTVWPFNRPSRSESHPTTKPIDLIEYSIKNSSLKGDAVLDLFGGSGSTIIACEKTGRRCFMMELAPGYCEVIIKRWQTYSGKQAYRETDGKLFDDIINGR